MTEKVDVKADALPDLDDLLQCPVCYEIPTGQIFQCNEGHHVCGRCKMRLDVCPVCRAFFFGTRNYAMEELIANIRKLRAFKLGGKVTTGQVSEITVQTRQSTSDENESADNEEEEEEDDASSRASVQAPKACKGLFRCLCCKNNPERLPAARLLNHLRYYHSPDLIEGRSENGEYLQAWQFSTSPGRLVTAVRITDMGIFFLIIEISNESVYAWLSMAASPWVAHEFSYTFTLSGNDREAIFSDCVWSVRSCEGSLKKRGRCLCVSGSDGRALLAPSAMSGKLSVRRTPLELLPHFTQPRAVLRVANRSNVRDAAPEILPLDLEPVIQDLQNDVARLSRAFITLGREANALVRSEAELRARLDTNTNNRQDVGEDEVVTPPVEPEPQPQPPAPNSQPETPDRSTMSRNARRRLRQRLRGAFREVQVPNENAPSNNTEDITRTNNQGQTNNLNQAINSNARVHSQNINNNRNQNSISRNHGTNVTAPSASNTQNTTNNRSSNNAPQQRNNTEVDSVVQFFSGLGVVVPSGAPSPPLPPPAQAGDTFANVNGTTSRNKKKRRHRR